MDYIRKDALITEINYLIGALKESCKSDFLGDTEESVASVEIETLNVILDTIEALEVVDPYEQWAQHESIKSGIQAHAETYSFNIESELYNQLTTKEQQELWRKEIEQACISGGEVGVELAKDPRYKENFEANEVEDEPELRGLEKEVAEAHVARLNRKRTPIKLRGKTKAKFKNEFNTLWQTVDGLQFANVARHIIERMCLHFASWGASNLNKTEETKL